MGDVRVEGARARWRDEDGGDASAPVDAPSSHARAGAERLDAFVLTQGGDGGGGAAAAAWAAAGRKPACGSPPPPAPSIPEQHKADNPDAVRRWLDPAYADRRAAEELAAAMRTAVAKQQGEDRLRLLVLQPPDAVKQTAVLGPVVIPIAETVHSVASITPVVGELVAGAEAITGNGLFGLGEKLSEEERSLNALIAATLVAGPLLEAGATGAKAVIQVAQRTGRTIEEVITALKAARSLKNDETVLREALALRKAGRALEPRHEAALRKAGAALEEVRGAARHSRFDPRGGIRGLMSNVEKAKLPVFRANADGARTVAQALAIARRNGVEIPAWIRFEAGGEMKNAYADYRLLSPEATTAGHSITWRDVAPRDVDVVVVRLGDAALVSDEALTAVIEHECYELTRVRRLLESSQASPLELDRWINDRIAGNLHDEAWDIADLRTLELRAPDPATRQMYRAKREKMIADFDRRRFGGGP